MIDPVQYTITGQNASAIARSVESAIRRGELRAGERLPPVRRLAGSLGVSPTTVAAAYRELTRRGIIVSRERSRSVVSDRPAVSARPTGARVPSGVRDLATGNPDPALLPDRTAALSSIPPDPVLYGAESAVPDLVELARAELRSIGIAFEHLCLVSGALDGVERALGAHLRPGDRVAVEDPGYANAFDLLRALGLTTVPVAVDDAGIRPDALERVLALGVEAILITPRGQNPTGAALDAQRASDLRSVLDAVPDVFVVEDDHLGRVAGVEPHTTLTDRRRWAFVRSVAKSLGPDLRLAFLAGDDETVGRIEGRLQLGPGWVSHVLQQLVVSLMSAPDIDVLLHRAADAYRERRQELISELMERGFEACGRTGFNVWVPVGDETAAAQGLLEAGWAVMNGAPCRIASPPAIRITASTLVPGESEEIAAALARSLDPSRRTRAA